MTYVFSPPPRPAVAVDGQSAAFPVRRIYCVGRNYAAHAREMGSDPDREPPFFFTKPADAVVESGSTIPYPSDTANLHHEIELVVAIGKRGRDIPADKALDHVFGYAVGIDLTRRDRQAEARQQGRPWDVSKAFDRSAPIGALVPASRGHIAKGRIWLAVNGEVRQDADVDQLTWPVPQIIAALSRSFELQPGDLIFTGTPEGVGPIKSGDEVSGAIEGVGEISLRIA